ncbi:MAG: hypothetical protein IKD89_04255 [Clostridia bacterium]|nr:hypothetical protein [Clostridia bacterium]
MAGYKIGDTRDLGYCAACGNVITIEANNGIFRPQRCGNPVKLKDGEWLCGSCLRKLRVKYPQDYKPDPVQKAIMPFESAAGLDAAEARRELSAAHDHLESLREKYGFHQAVFLVEDVKKEKSGFLKAPFITVTGHVIYGTFYPYDEAACGNAGYKAQIIAFETPHGGLAVNEQTLRRWKPHDLISYAWVDGGEEAAFVFRDKSLNLKPGDVIIKD